MKVRKAELTDLDQLTPIQKEVQDLHIKALPEVYCELTAEEYQRQMHGFISDSATTVLVAEEEGKIVGYGVIKIKESPDNPFRCGSRYAEIDQIAVLSTYQNNGIASKLIEVSKDMATQESCIELRLAVLEFNIKAIKFYEKQQFKTTRRRMVLKLN